MSSARLSALRRTLRLLLFLSGFFAVPAFAQDSTPITFPGTQYEPMDWANLDGWESDDHAAAFSAFLTSCQTLDTKRHQDLTGIPGALRDV